MRLSAVVGLNWGDEGKGRMVDLLTEDCDAVVRYQGGGNAGHTVENELGKFALHLLPSGVFRPGVLNVLGPGVALDCQSLLEEMEELRRGGVCITPENLLISERAALLLPWHRQEDALEEARLGAHKYGSTVQGIAPFYGDKYRKKVLRAGDLRFPERLEEELESLLEWKGLGLRGLYGAAAPTAAELRAWLRDYAEPLLPYLGDTGGALGELAASGGRILFEAQLGALRDIDCGIFPYTTSSHTLASYAFTGAGMAPGRLDEVVGVAKAYSTCVGEGPFVCEWRGPEAERLREEGAEYGARTGRPRRVGPMDLVATRCGARLQGAAHLALTKLDVLGCMDRVPLCTAYSLRGAQTRDFPYPALLDEAEPVTEYMEGWRCDVSGARRWTELPEAARRYVRRVEEEVGVPLGWLSVGPRREQYIRL